MASITYEHPQKALNDFIQMYSSHIGTAMAERKKTGRRNGCFVDLKEGNGSVVPDMSVCIEDSGTLRMRVDQSKPGSAAAVKMLLNAKEDEYAFGVFFGDGDCMMALTSMHKSVDV